jgi:hypothetical protein
MAISFAALEAAVRVVFDAPLLSFQDRRERRDEVDQTSSAIYHEVLGWSVRPGITSPGFNTIDYGIRKNSANTETLSEGGILAVGDSFTAGSEVVDEQTWPAHLERLVQQRVFNAASGGYGTDQAVLRIEELLPVLKPKVVLLGVLAPSDVERAGYSVYGRPKPYFIREGADYSLKQNPVPRSAGPSPDTPLYKRVLSTFMTFNLIFERLTPDWWFSDIGGQRYERIANNPIAVTCHLLDRLQGTLSTHGTRAIVVLQHGGWIFARREARSPEADGLRKCAGELGYEVVDEYDSLRAIAAKSTDELQLNYVMHDGGATYGHMSGQGNENIARLIAEALGVPASMRRAPTVRTTLTDSDGINRLSGIGLQHLSAANGVMVARDEKGPLDGPDVLRFTPNAVKGEHYVATTWTADQPGTYTLSVYVRQLDAGGVRLQLLDAASNGLSGDYTDATRVFDIF